jgi:hypothetical protein
VPGPYTRVASGDPGNSGATSAVTVVNAHSAGLEALEAGGVAHWVSCRDYGIINDGYTAVVTVGSGASPTVTVTSSVFPSTVFTAGDVGKAIHIAGAMTGSDNWFRTTITGFTSSTQVTVAGTATNPGTAKTAIIGTDNTSDIDAMAAALPRGSVAFFPGGDKFYLTQGEHSFDQSRLVFCGDGSGNTRFVSTALTGTVLTFASTLSAYTPCDQVIRDFSVWHGSYYAWGVGTLPTSAVAVEVTEGTDTYWDGYVGGLELTGYHKGLVMSAVNSHIDRCKFSSCVDTSILIDSAVYDGGGVLITGCTFGSATGYLGASTYTTNHVKWLAGGGVSIQSCRFQACQNGVRIDALFPGGAAFQTGDFTISGNYFEDFFTNAVNVTTGTNTYLKYLTVGNNACYGLASSTVFNFVATETGGIAALAVIGNAYKGPATTFLNLVKCADVKAMNAVETGTAELAQSGCTNVDVY